MPAIATNKHAVPGRVPARPRSNDDRGAGSTMQSVQRVCSILLSFKVEEPILGVSEIARRLDLPKSAVHRLLDSLVQLGLVARDRASSRYRLGPRAVELGFAALGTPDIVAWPCLCCRISAAARSSPRRCRCLPAMSVSTPHRSPACRT